MAHQLDPNSRSTSATATSPSAANFEKSDPIVVSTKQLNGEPILPISTAPSTLAVQESRWTLESTGAWLKEDLDVDGSTLPLAAFCFMTGYVDAVSFTACFIWCAFQTGNTIQLSLALARLFSGPERGFGFLMPDRQALTSLTSFIGGSFLGRIGDRYGAKTRGWNAFGTLLQAGLTLAASLCAIYAHQDGLADSRAGPSWTNGLGFMALAFSSASMGLQALQGTRMGSQFATTVVITSVWAQLIGDPVLLKVNKAYKQRDYKILGIFSIFLGGFCGRALTGSIGPAGTLGIGAGFRLFIALSWLFVPKKKAAAKK